MDIKYIIGKTFVWAISLSTVGVFWVATLADSPWWAFPLMVGGVPAVFYATATMFKWARI